MATLIKEYDLNKSIKSQTFKLTKDSENKITFTNDMAGQVVYKELNNKIAIEIYETTKITNSYTKTVNYYYNITDSDKCNVTSTKYVWAKVEGEYKWKSENTKSYVISKSAIPAFVTTEKPYQVEYVMTSKGNNSESSLTSTAILAAGQLDARDALYKERFIDKFGLVSKTLTENVEATIYLDKGNIASKMLLEAVNISERDLLTQTYAPQRKGNKYTGMYLNETVTSSEANETFDLKTGDDEVNFAFADGVGKVGNDVINLVKDEILTLRMMNSTDNTTGTEDPDAEFLVNTSYTKKGNDLVMKYTNKYDDVLGQTTIKNYFKIAQDNITMKYSGASSSVVDYDYSLKEYLEWQDGIGIIGDDEAKTAQKITGNFLDNTLLGGSGNDTIKGVAGDNFIIAGAGDDKLYCGKDSDSFFIYRGDAKGLKGDTVYNADKFDSVYFYNENGDVDPLALNSNHYEFTKKGNTLTISHNDTPSALDSKDDKVTFVDYFKKNTELFNINDADVSKAVIKQSAKGSVYGTNYGDDITLTGKSNVYTGNGNDTVKFYYQTGDTEHGYTTHVVDKNVNVYIDGTGNKVLLRNSGATDPADTGNMGNKTLIFNTVGTNDDKVRMNLGVNPEQIGSGEGYICTKKGNDLVIEGYYGMTGSYDPAAGTDYDSYGSYTVKNYFSEKFSYEGKLCVDSDSELDLDDFAFLYQQGKKNKAATFYDTKYNDYILGGSKNDKYYFTNGGSDKAVDVKGNDTYNVEVNSNASEVKIFDSGKGNDKYNFTKSDLSTTVYINDDGGKKDSLVITSLNPESKISVGVLFNVLNKDYSGSVVDSKFLKDDALFLYNKANNLKTSGHIEIGNYFAKDSEGTYSKGAGVIETMKLDGVNIDVSHLDAIRSQVVNFLTNDASKSYASAYQCLMTGSDEDVTALINAYTYNQTT